MDQALIEAAAKFGAPSLFAILVMLAYYKSQAARDTANQKLMTFMFEEQRAAQKDQSEKLAAVLEATVRSANAQTETASQLRSLVEELKYERQHEPRRSGSR